VNVRYETAERITVITIDRPERRNAVDEATAQELFGSFASFESDSDSDVAILTGAGGTFCSGFDLKAAAAGELQRIEAGGRAPMGPTRMRLAKPVIAAIEGYAVAGGMELALWCDLRVAASDAVLGIFNRRFGVPLVDLGTIRLPRLIGHSVAMDLILTGRPIGAVEAKSIGLVNRIAPNGEALNAARALARELSAFPQSALRNDRLSAIEQWDLPMREAQESEIRHGLEVLASGEALRGAQRFVGGDGRHGTGSAS
jgi:enoyl-CoA hydratase